MNLNYKPYGQQQSGVEDPLCDLKEKEDAVHFVDTCPVAYSFSGFGRKISLSLSLSRKICRFDERYRLASTDPLSN